jgi:hypothetical protein
LFQETGQFALSVGDEVRLVSALLLLREGCDNLPQNVERFVDVYTFFGLLPSGACQALFLRACKVNQLQLGDSHS